MPPTLHLPGVEILAPISENHAQVLTPAAIDFIVDLHRTFNPRRKELLERRRKRQVRLDAGSANWHDVQDAREQSTERYNSLQDANFQLERARITLLRATGELESWIGVGK